MKEKINTYIVEKILAHDYQCGKLYYKIKWLGFPLKKATWEPYYHVEANECINEYLKLSGLKSLTKEVDE